MFRIALFERETRGGTGYAQAFEEKKPALAEPDDAYVVD